MRAVLTVAGIAGALYAAVVVFFYLRQGALLYPASPERATPGQAGLSGFEDVVLDTPDGERVMAWYRAPQPGRAVVLYFHGNGGSLMNRGGRARLLTDGGRGLLLASYRGYSGSTGKPTETGLRTDARTAYDWLAQRAAPERIVLYGESLGTGVAVGLATERQVAGIVLDAPFTSAADVAGHHFRFLPTWLLRDQYRSLDRIRDIHVPLLVIHGDRDGVVPFTLGEQLYAHANEPKRFLRIGGGDHVSNLEAGGLKAVRTLLADVEANLPPPR